MQINQHEIKTRVIVSWEKQVNFELNTCFKFDH